MKIIVTAAGRGKRFTDIGIKIPKYQIKVKNKSLFSWSLLSLNNFFNKEFILIFNKENYDKHFVQNEMSTLGIQKYKVIILKEITDGQASTVMFANKFLKENESIIIYNIDTGIKSNVITPKAFSHDGTITTAIAKGEQ
jgi:choline kinase